MVRPNQKHLHFQGIIILVITTVMWSTTFAGVKGVVHSISPAALITTRFTMAAAIFSPSLRRLDARLLLDGTILGILLFFSFVTQMVGLETTSANRAAFIISLSIIFVPLFQPLFGKQVPPVAFLAAGLAVTGIGIMSWESGALVIGDLWILSCALTYAIYILILERFATRHPSVSLSAVQLLVSALLGWAWAAPEFFGQLSAIGNHIGIVLYLGLIPTAAAIWTQAVGQRWVPATEAALIYALEPIFASIFSFWLLGERFGMRGVFGAALVVAAMVLSQIRK
jgi:drug/metabolite transporter (DMT)-like permease